MEKTAKIYLAGHQGLVGSAIHRKLSAAGFERIITRTFRELDLRSQPAAAEFFAAEKPEYVFLAAAKVGGILANNTYPAEFIHDNLAIQTNVIHQSYLHGVKKLLFLGSSCIYPKLAPQPMKEEHLLTGVLEPTNEPYAIAKIAGIKMCQAYNRQYGTRFISVMPTNLYGPNDNFDLQTSHVLPALIRKFHEAKINNRAFVEIWGSGLPRREFLHVDDLAEACLLVAELPRERYAAVTAPMLSHLNVGTGEDVSIRELAELVRAAVGFQGRIEFDRSYPDGTPRKLLDVAKLKGLGWQPRVGLAAGIRATVDGYRAMLASSASKRPASIRRS